ncbi:MAG: hypothetical protein JXR96_06280 [Deltaproteobacteria bacterium]|nr:hypothetical protein [Deltaproteobacteria bacterium]
MRTGIAVCTLLVAAGLMIPAPLSAQGLLDGYTAYWDDWVERLEDMDLYGLTAQLPKGVFAFKFEWNMRNAVGRYNHHRVRTDMVEPIAFGEEGQEDLMLDLGASGGGGGITMQFSYGLTDPLDFYFELPFQYMNIQMRPKLLKLNPDYLTVINSLLSGTGYPRANPDWFDENGMTLDEFANEASAWFLGYLPRLGRPPMSTSGPYPEDKGPGKEFDSNGWMLADINLGFSWNYFRSARWSGALTGRVHLPTGNTADPNNALTMGTGPAIDQGTGSFGIGATKGYDVRIFRYKHWIDIVASAELTATYYFKSKRRYPDFPAATSDGNAILDLLDKERNYFPDMSDLTGKTYEYTPGVGVDANIGLSISCLMIDFGANLGYSYAQEPELKADWRFEQMVRNLEMQAAGHYEVLRVAAGINLFPFYVPLQIHYQYEKNIGGRYTLIFDDNHWITVQGYLPTF